MKKRWLALGLVFALLLALTACQKDETQPQGDDNPIQSLGILDGAACSVQKLVADDLKAYEVLSVSEGWAVIAGSYKDGEKGMFYVNAKGEVLGDKVYDVAYSFSAGTACVLENNQWYLIDTEGAVVKELGNWNPGAYDLRYGKECIEQDGEELWYATYQGKAITEPIFHWISGISSDCDTYAILAHAEHPNVLLNMDGEIVTVLPDDCTDAYQGENSIIAKYEDGYGLLDVYGEKLSDHRYDALTQVEQWLSVGITDGRVMLLDECGKPLVELDVTPEETVERTSVDFDGDLIAVVGENDQLVLLRLVFDETPIRRQALELVEKARKIFYFYLSGDTDYDVDYAAPTQGVDWLYEGTTATYLGKPLELTSDFKRFEGEVMGQKVDSLDDLRQAVETVLTPKAAEERYFNKNDKYPYFVEYEGHLFRVAGDGAFSMILDRGSITILSQSETSVEFSVAFYLNSRVDCDTAYFQMKKTENGWRLNTPYPGYDYPIK